MRSRYSVLKALLLAAVVGVFVLLPGAATAKSSASAQEVGVFSVVIGGNGAGAVVQSLDDPTPDPRIECAKGLGDVEETGRCDLAEGVGGQPFPRIVGLLALTPNDSAFAGWAVFPDDTPQYGCGGELECWVLADEDVTVVAVFDYSPGEVPLGVVRKGPDARNGSVVSMPSGVNCSAAGRGDCQGRFRPGTVVRLEAKPGPDGSFGGWSGPCKPSEDIATVCVATMPVSGNITATFNIATEKLSVAADGDGYVATNVQPGISCPTVCEASFRRGATVTLNAYPDIGQRFAGWEGAQCTGTQCTVTMSQAQSVSARFEAAPVQASLISAAPIVFGSNLGRRAVLVAITAREEVDVVIRVRRSGVTLATRRIIAFEPDTELLQLNVPRIVRAGRAIVEVSFVNDADTLKTQRRAIRIPRLP